MKFERQQSKDAMGKLKGGSGMSPKKVLEGAKHKETEAENYSMKGELAELREKLRAED